MMTLLRTLLLVLPLVATTHLIAAEVHPVAVPAQGAIPGIAFPSSVAYGPDGGVAVWRVGFGQIWGVALDGSGRPTSLARLVVDDPEGTVSPVVQFAPDGFSIWWRPLWTTKRARLERTDLSVTDVRRLADALEPLASGPAGTLAWNARADSSSAMVFVSPDGTVVHEWSLSEIGPLNVARAVVMSDGTFALATSGWDGLHLTRFSAEGQKLGAPLTIELAAGTTAPDYRPHLASMASDGTAVVIAAIASEHQREPDLKTYRVERDDTISARHTIVSNRWSIIREAELQRALSGFTIVVSAVGGDATNAGHFDLFAARLGDEGDLFGEFVPIFAAGKSADALTSAAFAGRHLVFFHSGDFGAGTIFSIALPAEGSIERPDLSVADARVSDGPASQVAPDAASDGNGWLVAWLEKLAEREEIRVAALNADGSPAGPAVTVRSIFRYLGPPRVEFDGIDYVVSWNEGLSLFAVRIPRGGSVSSPAPVLISNDADGSVSTAARNGATMFAWGSGEIEVAVMRADGAVTQPIRISAAARWENDERITYERPILAAGDNSFLVAWRESRWLDCGMIITCPTSGRAQARLVSTLGIPRFGELELDTGMPTFAAGTGGTFLLMDQGRRGKLIDEASARMTDLHITQGPFLPFEHFGVNGEYIIPYSDAAYAPLRIRRYSSDGRLTAMQTIDAVDAPSAVSSAGTLLVVRSKPIAGPPWYGAPGIVSQVIDTFLPYAPPARQRSAGR